MHTFTLWSVLLVFAWSAYPASAGSRERKLYVGSDSTEALMRYDYRVRIKSRAKPSMSAVRQKIENQVMHLYGPMGEAAVKAVPRGSHEIKNVRVAKVEGETGLYEARYSYEGVIVLGNGPADSYEIVLPLNPDEVYEAGMSGRHNPCTDHHYQSEGDFWYFWNPESSGCKLQEGVDYDRVKARIKRIANMPSTYPEYDRMVEGGEINVHILMGMDSPDKGRDPLTSRDINAQNYRGIRESLVKAGFADRRWSKSDYARVLPAGPAGNALPYVEELTKDNAKARIVVRLFFGPSGIDEDSGPFHYFFKDALENASAMIYDGHSGLGGHLDLGSIESQHRFRMEPNPDRYQIYFFNSCSSYSYYNTMFFGRKATREDPKGTKNLDILTNGLATYFYVLHDTNMALLKALDLWSQGRGRVSYQALAKQIDSGNLFGINGDEDNPR